LPAIFISESAVCCFLVTHVIYANSVPASDRGRILTSFCPDISHKKLVANERKNKRPYLRFSLISFPENCSLNPSSITFHDILNWFSKTNLFINQNKLKKYQQFYNHMCFNYLRINYVRKCLNYISLNVCLSMQLNIKQ